MNPNRNPVGWFEIYVQDMDRAKTFYEKTLEVAFEKLESPGMELWAFPMNMDAPGAAGWRQGTNDRRHRNRSADRPFVTGRIHQFPGGFARPRGTVGLPAN